MNVSLARVVALEHAARALLLHILELRKEVESSIPSIDTSKMGDATPPTPNDGQEACPVNCVAKYRMSTPVMGHLSRSKCRMCGRTYDE